MTDRPSDPNKRVPECRTHIRSTDCPNLVETNPTDMSGEHYRCDVCGESFRLDYDEMR